MRFRTERLKVMDLKEHHPLDGDTLIQVSEGHLHTKSKTCEEEWVAVFIPDKNNSSRGTLRRILKAVYYGYGG